MNSYCRETSRHQVSSVSCLVVAMVVLFVGCGPQRPATIPVEGVVTLDGQPVAEATLLFLPSGGGRPAEGVTDGQGHFTLSTFAPGDGALPGTHRVTVQKVREKNAPPASKLDTAFVEPELEWLLPRRYSQPATSGLTVEVTDGMPPVQMTLSSR